jgi:hypothetical protein
MVTGENFGEGSTVRWNGWNRVTQYKSAGELTATIPADDISRPNAVTVTVKNADGQESGGAAFTVMEAAGLEPPSPFVLPPPSRKVTTTEAACVRGRYLSPITDVTVGRKDGGPCAIAVRDVIVEDTSVCFTMVMPCDTEGGEHVIRLHYGQDEPQTLDVPMTIVVARPPPPPVILRRPVFPALPPGPYPGPGGPGRRTLRKGKNPKPRPRPDWSIFPVPSMSFTGPGMTPGFRMGKGLLLLRAGLARL